MQGFKARLVALLERADHVLIEGEPVEYIGALPGVMLNDQPIYTCRGEEDEWHMLDQEVQVVDGVASVVAGKNAFNLNYETTYQFTFKVCKLINWLDMKVGP